MALVRTDSGMNAREADSLENEKELSQWFNLNEAYELMKTITLQYYLCVQG